MRHQYAQLLANLSKALGRESAALELRWMMQASEASHAKQGVDLASMVNRRVSGEPLQYILGE